MSTILPLVLLPEEEIVVLQELADKQENIYCRDAVGHHAAHEFSLRGILSLDENLVPQSGKLLVVFLQLVQ